MRLAVPAFLAAALGFAAPAGAATLTVNTTADVVDAAPGDGACASAGGSCSLRAAVIEANTLPGPDTIVLPAGRYTLTLAGAGEDAAATGDLDVLSDVTITGAGAATTIIDAGGIDRVFDNLDTLRLTSLTVEGGRTLDTSFDGGGGLVNSAFLYLTDVVVRANTAALGGGGILNYSDLFISDSTIEGNTVVASDPPAPQLGGGGIGNEANLRIDRSAIRGNTAPFGGGLANDANAFVTGSTLSGNTAAESGGGIWNNSNLTVVSSTITGNAAFIGSGISDGWGSNDRLAGVTLDGDIAFAGNTEIVNTILTGACILTTDGSWIFSHGHNLARDPGCALFADGDQLGVDPLLGPLQDNGGPTETKALLSGSPALDAGGDEPVSLPGWSGQSGDFTGACPATDQRGYSRPQGTSCDLGAYEAAVAVPPSGSYAAKVLDRSPVAYWRLGEAEGPDAVDASGFENTGTYGGGVTLGVPGAIAGDPDTAVTFDGLDGHVTVPPSVHLFSFWGRLSVELWVKGGPQAPDRYLISHNDAGDTRGFGITTGPTGTLRFFVDLWGRQLTHDIPFDWDCRWHHVVGIYDGSTLRLYVDGRERANAYLRFGDAGSPEALEIGRFTGGGSAFTGSLDEVAIYREVLTPAQIAAHAAFRSSADGCGVGTPASIALVKLPTGDAYDDDAFRLGGEVRFHASFSGPVSSADLYVDGGLVSTGFGAGTFAWEPGAYAAHTLVLKGRDAGGNDVVSNAVSLVAIVESEAGIVSFLRDGRVPDNPFSTDPEVPPPGYPTGTEGFRQAHDLVLKAKTDGISLIPGSAHLAADQQVSESFYCDDPSHLARKSPASFVDGPTAAGDGYVAASFLQSRVDVVAPMVFDVTEVPGIGPPLQELLAFLTSGRTGDSPFTPWIHSRISGTVTPAGPRFEWRDEASLFPEHFLYLDRRPAAGPLPFDLQAWLNTAPLVELIRGAGIDLPRGLTFFGAEFYFKALRAECARRRMQAVNPSGYDVLHRLAPRLPVWLRLGLRQDVFVHFNRHEVDQGVARRGFRRDQGCVIPFCFGGPETLLLFHSPVAVHVTEPDGTHVGPRDDGTIERGSPAVTYEMAGHTTLVILPSDPAYRVSFEGTGTGLVTIDLQQFDGGHRILLEQFAELTVTPGASGSVELGPAPVVRYQDAVLAPTTFTTSETLETEDVTAPTTRAEVDGLAGEPGFFRSAVTIRLVPSDDLSGIESSEISLDGGATWGAYTGPVPLDREGTYALAFRSIDRMGNAEAGKTVVVVVDTLPPGVSIRSPEATTYLLRQRVAADYECSDAGSGIATCTGPVPDGGSVPTGTVGDKSFAVRAADRAGNTSSAMVSYAVAYVICHENDDERQKPKKAGHAVRVEVELCDASARDVSSPPIVLTARSVVRTADGAVFPARSADRANPGNRFRFEGGAYVFKLATRDLTPGEYELLYTAGDDPTTHAFRFALR
jgi:CSLREA domain-containing protein